MMRQIAFTLLIFFGLASSRVACAAGLGDLLPGARGAALGSAYTALADGPYGMFYNPAGLARNDFTQISGTTGRLISPDGLASLVTVAYSRPFPIIPGSNFGAALHSAQQSGTEAQRNEFLLHFSHSRRFPQLRMERPLQYGANVKIRQVVPGRSEKVNKVGLGLDAGVIYDTGYNWKVGMSVLNLESDVGFPTPALNLGFVYRWHKRVNTLLDLHIRSGLTEFIPALEIDVYQRLLKLRLAKGQSFDAQKQISMGLGINYSPVILDVNWNIPFKGANSPAGMFQVSLTYKFGAPPFYGRFVGAAAREAEDLRSSILSMEERKKTLDASIEASRAENDGLAGQIDAREGRLRELENNIRQLEFNRDKKIYDQGHPAPKPAAKPAVKPAKSKKKSKALRKKAIRHRRRHTVQPGDTLRKLAEKYYDDPTLWEIIYDANPQKIERGLPIEGASLLIPVPERR